MHGAAIACDLLTNWIYVAVVLATWRIDEKNCPARFDLYANFFVR